MKKIAYEGNVFFPNSGYQSDKPSDATQLATFGQETWSRAESALLRFSI